MCFVSFKVSLVMCRASSSRAFSITSWCIACRWKCGMDSNARRRRSAALPQCGRTWWSFWCWSAGTKRPVIWPQPQPGCKCLTNKSLLSLLYEGLCSRSSINFCILRFRQTSFVPFFHARTDGVGHGDGKLEILDDAVGRLQNREHLTAGEQIYASRCLLDDC